MWYYEKKVKLQQDVYLKKRLNLYLKQKEKLRLLKKFEEIKKANSLLKIQKKAEYKKK